ncbi:MAG: hypothetical protein AAB853_00785 [Patescibacteria group bacterium]
MTSEDHGKEALAATEDDLIVEIPLVVWIRPVVVQPRAVLVALAVEDVRVAVGIGSVSRAIGFTARLENENRLNRTCDHQSSSTGHQVTPFLKEHHASPL